MCKAQHFALSVRSFQDHLLFQIYQFSFLRHSKFREILVKSHRVVCPSLLRWGLMVGHHVLLLWEYPTLEEGAEQDSQSWTLKPHDQDDAGPAVWSQLDASMSITRSYRLPSRSWYLQVPWDFQFGDNVSWWLWCGGRMTHVQDVHANPSEKACLELHWKHCTILLVQSGFTIFREKLSDFNQVSIVNLCSIPFLDRAFCQMLCLCIVSNASPLQRWENSEMLVGT